MIFQCLNRFPQLLDVFFAERQGLTPKATSDFPKDCDNLAIKLIPDLMDISGRSSWIPLSFFQSHKCLFFLPVRSERSERRRESFFSRLSFFGFQRGKEIFNFETALPSLKRTVRTRKLGHPERKRSYSNHPFSGAMLVSGRVNDRWKGLELGEFCWSIWEQVHYILKQRRAWRNLPKMDN